MKFSIVTPSYNSERYISETIESVISQRGNFFIEYIIVDGKSTDATLAIVSKYIDGINSGSFGICRCNGIEIKLISEKDTGMYDAINKGFSLATGDIFAYINSDDIYLSGVFSTVANVFKSLSEVNWVKGITSYIDESSAITEIGKCYLYHRPWICNGYYGTRLYFIQQDSVFWRSSLWRNAGFIDPKLRLAGDYFLWKKFAEYTPLYSIKAYLSCFRSGHNQLSKDTISYHNEIKINFSDYNVLLRFFIKYTEWEYLLSVCFKKLLYRLLFSKLEHNAIIEDNEGKYKIVKSNYFYIDS